MDQVPRAVIMLTTQYICAGHYKMTTTYDYCTYLNSRLLEAPRKYILHGPIPGLD
jgi:hypothetical protein